MVQALTLAALMLAGAGERSARLHFKEAEKFYAKGFYDDALIEYERAYEAKPLPGFLFNVGQCHRNLGHYQEAIDAFKRYLSQKPNAANRASVELLVQELTKKQESLEASRRKTEATPPTEPERARAPTTPTRTSLAAPEPAGQRAPRAMDPEAIGAMDSDLAAAPSTPYYKRWWFWTAVGVVALGAGVGIYYGTHRPTEIDNANLPGISYP